VETCCSEARALSRAEISTRVDPIETKLRSTGNPAESACDPVYPSCRTDAKPRGCLQFSGFRIRRSSERRGSSSGVFFISGNRSKFRV
jgi:hypothetical protein